jgi:hypothetical protein
MSQLSSQPPEIRAAKNLSQPPRSESSAWAREKRFADVLGRRMAYVERGMGTRSCSFTATRPPRSCGEASCRMSRPRPLH